MFTFKPFDRLAQIAPGFGLAASDFDGDGHEDIVMAQNFFHPQRETGRMNGGLGVFLKGEWGRETLPQSGRAKAGSSNPGDAQSLAVTECERRWRT